MVWDSVPSVEGTYVPGTGNSGKDATARAQRASSEKSETLASQELSTAVLGRLAC